MRIIGNDPNTPRQTQVVASGTLSTGDTVIVNADGTVSAVEEIPVSEAVGTPVTFAGNSYLEHNNGVAYDSTNNKVIIAFRNAAGSSYGTAIVGTVNASTNSISFGSGATFNSAFTSAVAVTYDSTNQKVVIAYRDHGNSNQGTAIVGTVSGTSISFGSETVFETGRTEDIAIGFDPSQGKVVIAYKDVDDSNKGKSIVGTVSGTSISFGSITEFDSGYTIHHSWAYDSGNQKMILGYHDGSTTNPTAVVATVSGTSISFGTPSAAQSVNGNYTSVAYDSNSERIVLAYRNENNSNYGTAAVGTVSGTSISFGTPVVFESANSQHNMAVFDSTNNKVVIAFQDQGNFAYGTLIVGTVSGTSISFGSPVVFETSDSEGFGGIFDTLNGKVVFGYRDNGNSGAGTAVVFQNTSTEPNLTAENYIGIAKSGAADGDGVVVNTQGNVDTGQTGLTAGQSYYVQTDGTLSTTAGDPSVFAGTAVSATKLIVKG